MKYYITPFLLGWLLLCGLGASAQKFYYIQKGNTEASTLIGRANPDGTDVEVLVSGTSNFTNPTVLAVDGMNGTLYVVDSAAGSGILRFNLDGSGRQLVVATASGVSVEGLALDMKNGKLYFTQASATPELNAVKRCNLDGSDVEEVIAGASHLTRPGPITVDMDRGAFYVGDDSYGVLRYSISTLDRAVIVAPATPGLWHATGLAIHTEFGWLFVAQDGSDQNSRGVFMTRTTGGSYTLAFHGFPDKFKHPGSLAYDNVSSYSYVTDIGLKGFGIHKSLYGPGTQSLALAPSADSTFQYNAVAAATVTPKKMGVTIYAQTLPPAPDCEGQVIIASNGPDCNRCAYSVIWEFNQYWLGPDDYQLMGSNFRESGGITNYDTLRHLRAGTKYRIRTSSSGSPSHWDTTYVQLETQQHTLHTEILSIRDAPSASCGGSIVFKSTGPGCSTIGQDDGASLQMLWEGNWMYRTQRQYAMGTEHIDSISNMLPGLYRIIFSSASAYDTSDVFQINNLAICKTKLTLITARAATKPECSGLIKWELQGPDCSHGSQSTVESYIPGSGWYQHTYVPGNYGTGPFIDSVTYNIDGGRQYRIIGTADGCHDTLYVSFPSAEKLLNVRVDTVVQSTKMGCGASVSFTLSDSSCSGYYLAETLYQGDGNGNYYYYRGDYHFENPYTGGYSDLPKGGFMLVTNNGTGVTDTAYFSINDVPCTLALSVLKKQDSPTKCSGSIKWSAFVDACAGTTVRMHLEKVEGWGAYPIYTDFYTDSAMHVDSITNLPPGQYQLRLNDYSYTGTSCVKTQPFTIYGPETCDLSIQVAGVTHSTLKGCNGRVRFQVRSGACFAGNSTAQVYRRFGPGPEDYEYILDISGPSGNWQDSTDLPAGKYVLVAYENNCYDSTGFTINEPADSGIEFALVYKHDVSIGWCGDGYVKWQVSGQVCAGDSIMVKVNRMEGDERQPYWTQGYRTDVVAKADSIGPLWAGQWQLVVLRGSYTQTIPFTINDPNPCALDLTLGTITNSPGAGCTGQVQLSYTSPEMCGSLIRTLRLYKNVGGTYVEKIAQGFIDVSTTTTLDVEAGQWRAILKLGVCSDTVEFEVQGQACTLDVSMLSIGTLNAEDCDTQVKWQHAGELCAGAERRLKFQVFNAWSEYWEDRFDTDYTSSGPGVDSTSASPGRHRLLLSSGGGCSDTAYFTVAEPACNLQSAILGVKNLSATQCSGEVKFSISSIQCAMASTYFEVNKIMDDGEDDYVNSIYSSASTELIVDSMSGLEPGNYRAYIGGGYCKDTLSFSIGSGGNCGYALSTSVTGETSFALSLNPNCKPAYLRVYDATGAQVYSNGYLTEAFQDTLRNLEGRHVVTMVSVDSTCSITDTVQLHEACASIATVLPQTSLDVCVGSVAILLNRRSPATQVRLEMNSGGSWTPLSVPSYDPVPNMIAFSPLEMGSYRAILSQPDCGDTAYFEMTRPLDSVSMIVTKRDVPGLGCKGAAYFSGYVRSCDLLKRTYNVDIQVGTSWGFVQQFTHTSGPFLDSVQLGAGHYRLRMANEVTGLVEFDIAPWQCNLSVTPVGATRVAGTTQQYLKWSLGAWNSCLTVATARIVAVEQKNGSGDWTLLGYKFKQGFSVVQDSMLVNPGDYRLILDIAAPRQCSDTAYYTVPAYPACLRPIANLVATPPAYVALTGKVRWEAQGIGSGAMRTLYRYGNSNWAVVSTATASAYDSAGNLQPGQYQLLLTDGYCIDTASFVVNPATECSAQVRVDSVRAAAVYLTYDVKYIDGAFLVTTQRHTTTGWTNYATNWFDAADVFRATRPNLPAGQYRVIVNNFVCSDTAYFTPYDPSGGCSADVAVLHVDNSTQSNAFGKAKWQVTISGAAQMLLQLKDGNNWITQQTLSYTGSRADSASLGAGQYRLLLQVGACTDTASFTISAPYQWPIAFGNTGDNVVRGIVRDGQGNIYASITFTGTINLQGTSISAGAKRDGLLAKFTDAGQLLWYTRIGNNTFNTEPQGINIDGSGNPYWAGSFAGAVTFSGSPNQVLTAAGSYDAYVARFDPATGKCLWAKRVGGPGNDYLYACFVSNSGNVYAGGSYTGSISFQTGATSVTLPNAGGLDGFIVKFDPNGTGIYASHLGSAANDEVKSIEYMGGDLIACGYMGDGCTFPSGTPVVPTTMVLASTGGSRDGFAGRVNSTGQWVWVKNFGTIYNDEAMATCMDPSTGNLFVAAQVADAPMTFNGIAYPGKGNNDIAVVGWNFYTQAPVWAKRVGSTTGDSPSAIRWDGQRLVVSGYTGGAVVASASLTLASHGGQDAILMRYDKSTGAITSGQMIGGATNDQALALWCNTATREAFVGGYYTGSVIIPGAAMPITAAGSSDGFLCRVGALANARAGEEISLTPTLKAYPVPFRNSLTVETAEAIQLLDLEGRTLLRVEPVEGIATFRTEGLPSGLYILRAANGQVLRVVKE